MGGLNRFHQTESKLGAKPEDSKDVVVHNLIRDVASQLRPGRIEANHELLKSIADAAATGGLVEDRQYVAEKLIQALASLPDDSKIADIGTGLILKNLWDNLEHPPLSYMGDAYKYRMADGCNNNVMFPHIGRSGSFYARSVTPRHVHTSLPDPSTLFDALLARQGPNKPHPNEISSLLFALATIIIHDIFRTSDVDQNIVAVSSYLDLSPLYGPNQQIQNTVRTFTGGTLKPDSFAEVRLLGQPPECAALLIAFNRFHNHVAEQLTIINEGGKFGLPDGISKTSGEAYEKALAKQDNDLFQTARLVTGGLYIQIITNDYFRTILNLQRTDTIWNLNPRKDYPEFFGQESLEKGIGNHVSIEFNLIYRWHSVVSDKNERWLNSFFQKLFPNTRPEDITQPQFRAGMRAWALSLPSDPAQRTFAGLQRNSEGYFDDAGLTNILTEATEDVAGSFGARHVPIALKAVEILGIEQGRRWGTASLNELRRYFGMVAHKSFTDINSDPDVAASLEALYGDVENVEMYPGVVVEEAKAPMTPGSGLCAGFTTTRAILSDAVALTRGDRFYTLEYSPTPLTAWGIKEAGNDTSIAGGGVVYRLLMRAFPGWYRGNSIYALYPFTIPPEMRAIKQSLGQEAGFDYSRPQFVGSPNIVTTWKGVNAILLNPKLYRVPWGIPLRTLSRYEAMLGGDNVANTEQRKYIGRAIYGPETCMDDFRNFFDIVTADTIQRKSHKLRNIVELDTVKDVANLTWIRFAAKLFHIPLKDEKHPDATFTDRQLYDYLSKIYAYIFLDCDPASSFTLKKAALKACRNLTTEVRPVFEAVKGLSLGHFIQHHLVPMRSKLLPNHGERLLQRFFEGGKSVEEVTSWVILLSAAIAIPSAQAISQILDLFLREPYNSHWPEIQALSRDPSPIAFEKLRKYTLEALRLTTPVAGILRTASTDDTICDGHKTHQVKRGDPILLDISAASRDPEKFPAPTEIRLDRPEDGYLHFGYGMHSCLGKYIAAVGLTSQLRVFSRLKAMRRAPGLPGKLVSRDLGGVVGFLSEGCDEWAPLPISMKVHFEPNEYT